MRQLEWFYTTIICEIYGLVENRGEVVADDSNLRFCLVPYYTGLVISVQILKDRAVIKTGLGVVFNVPQDDYGFPELVIEVVDAIMHGQFIQYFALDDDGRNTDFHVYYASGSLGSADPVGMAVHAPAWNQQIMRLSEEPSLQPDED